MHYIFLYKFATNTIIKVARLGLGGDITPVGGTFDPNAIPEVLTSKGDVIFVANVNGGTARTGLFRFSGASPIKRVIVEGDPTPLGGTFIAAGWTALSPSGDGPLAFQGFITGGTSSHGFFLKRDIYVENPGPSDFITVAYAGQPTGILAGETFIDLSRDRLSVTRSGSVAFYAVFRRESIDYQGIFFWSNKLNQKFSKIAVAGDCTLSGGAYGGVSGPVLNDLGNLAFFVPQIISSPSCSGTVASFFQSFLALLRRGWHGVTSLLLGSEAEAATSTQGIFTSVVQVNNIPIADAGLDQSVSAGATVTLDGTGSSDPDNDPLTYSWTQIAGPFVAINAAATAIANFTAHPVQAVTTLTFQLIVNDGQVDSDPAMTDITVNPPPPPGSYTLTVTPPSNGTVMGSGITCPGDCSETYSSGASVSLMATPASGFAFGGWGGDCGGQGNPCSLTMTSAKNVSATFTPVQQTGNLAVTVHQYDAQNPFCGGPPLQGAIVSISGPSSVPSQTTAADGTTTFWNLLAGTYTVSANLASYRPSSVQVNLEANMTHNVCFNMWPSEQTGISILTSTLPQGEVGVSYTQTLLAEGGMPPYTWSLAGGKKNKLPKGITLSSDGTLTGIPSKAKTTSFTVQVTDAAGVSATRSLSLQIVQSVKLKTKLSKGKVGTPYSATLQTRGGYRLLSSASLVVCFRLASPLIPLRGRSLVHPRLQGPLTSR